MINLKPLKEQLDNKPIAIFGLAKSGIATYEACLDAGIKTVLWDSNPEKLKEFEEKGAVVKDLSEADFSKFAYLCMSPGIPLTHPEPHPIVKRAQAAGCEIVSDVELFYRAYPEQKVIGITGSNGKSTTTALIGHILAEAGAEVAVGGNIGNAMMSLPQLSEKGIYVIELSSYQLDLCQHSPLISVFINISPDHLDRHGGLQGYIKAKERIFFGKGIAVIGVDDDFSKIVATRVKDKGERIVVKVSIKDDIDLSGCEALRGVHNKQNALMAYNACLAANVKKEAIIKALKTFPGLNHRQKLVATINGINYVNDSKATNDDAAATALATFDNIYWIAGGKSKNAGYELCAKYYPKIRAAFLIGAAAEEIEADLKKHGVEAYICGEMKAAIKNAKIKAEKDKIENSVILLSPACASFDQFKSFEHRGDVFAEIVNEIKASSK